MMQLPRTDTFPEPTHLDGEPNVNTLYYLHLQREPPAACHSLRAYIFTERDP